MFAVKGAIIVASAVETSVRHLNRLKKCGDRGRYFRKYFSKILNFFSSAKYDLELYTVGSHISYWSSKGRDQDVIRHHPLVKTPPSDLNRTDGGFLYKSSLQVQPVLRYRQILGTHSWTRSGIANQLPRTGTSKCRKPIGRLAILTMN